MGLKARMGITGLAGAMLVCCSGIEAGAADYNGTALRGSIAPPPYQEPSLFDGVYIGGTGSYSSANLSATTTARNLAATTYYGTDYENKASPSASSFVNVRKQTGQNGGYGGFVGYNSTWDDVVVGVEADYQRIGIKASSAFDTGYHNFDTGRTVDVQIGTDSTGNPITKTYAVGGNFRITGTDRTRITDVATLRGRAGYAMGNVLPYLTLGVAGAHGQRVTSITTTDFYSTQFGRISLDNVATRTQSNRDRFVAGLALGAGIDYAITPGIFFRAEYQYLKFSSFGGANIDLSSARAGVAAKF